MSDDHGCHPIPLPPEVIRDMMRTHGGYPDRTFSSTLTLRVMACRIKDRERLRIDARLRTAIGIEQRFTVKGVPIPGTIFSVTIDTFDYIIEPTLVEGPGADAYFERTHLHNLSLGSTPLYRQEPFIPYEVVDIIRPPPRQLPDGAPL